MMGGGRSATMIIDDIIFLVIFLIVLMGYAICGWVGICVVVRIVNSLLPPARRIPMRNWMMFGGPALLFVGIFAWHAVVRPPEWRSLLYEQTFDACRDGSMTRVRILLWLGASPDGISDYLAGPHGREFSSHVGVAVMNGDHRLLKLLLEKGANPNEDGCDSTPLSTAVHNHDAESVKLLLAHGADPRHGYWQESAADHAVRLKFHDLVPLIEPYLKEP